MSTSKIALVTGGNRGIGYAICKTLAEQGVHVLLGARDPASGENAAESLRSKSLAVEFVKLDVTDENDIKNAAYMVDNQFGKLDILINNAGIIGPSDDTSVLEKSTLIKTLEINFFGPFQVCQGFLELLKKSESGRIINISSGMGALSEMGSGHASYRLSKTALNGLTTALSADLASTNIKVNSVCPGWVKTRLGGDAAPRTPEKGAETAAWLALEADVPTAKFFRDKQIIEW